LYLSVSTKHPYHLLCLVFLSIGCQGAKDTGDDPQAQCAGGGDSSLLIGTGSAGLFEQWSEGSIVGLASAPQGGFGVWVRAKTTGIKAIQNDGTLHATSQVLLETYIDGELAGSFLNDTVEVYCQDDGTGLLWDVAVGFDPEKYATTDDLLSLNGQQTTLLVQATDEDGNIAEGNIDVVIEIGG